MAKEEKDESVKEEILAAIRQAASELGRAPSRGELRRITGVSHYRVLAEFKTLREAVRAAGLEPNPKGEKISTADLIQDWKRVGRKLGRMPSRAEYVREGRYSAGTFVMRFGSWGRVRGRLPKMPKVPKNPKLKTENRKGHEVAQREIESSDKATAFRWAASLAAIPGPLAGKRRVTEAVAQLVVNTLLSPANARAAFAGGPEFPNSNWQMAIGKNQNQEIHHNGHEGTQRGKGINKDRPVMGAPFDRSPLTNAPMNELGVVLLFGMVAADMGFQVESLQGKFPDCIAKREVAPGRWQHLRIEFEYESKNFFLHGHDPKGCDMIVCWRHNWRECPDTLEVIELCRIVRSL
ncbi:MAG: hypothetical protein LAO78_05800 [Acidobacteriia bacterium]|nr:hypothetical protein [Terriglobia bacterium]